MSYVIIYSAEYRYLEPVRDQHNVLRIRPMEHATQRLEGFDFSTDPGARLYTHIDYFGTAVVQFAIAEAHQSLEIRAESRVTSEEPAEPPACSWSQIEAPSYRELGAEYLGPLEPPARSDRVDQLVGEARGEDPTATALAVSEIIPDRFEYRSGVTYVGSTVDDLIEGGAGVCQDFVHLGLTMLRRSGIAARYVSGYLFAPGGEGEASAEVDTHAWIEVLLPSEEDQAPRWVGLDPTNRKLAGTDHVKIGHGRSYADVPPIRGVYRGSSESSLDVNVKMTKTQPRTGAH